MKKILIIVVVLLLFSAASDVSGKSTKFTKDRRAQVQQRRERILSNGNINNIYPKRFRVEWFIVNNKAQMGIIFNN